MKNKQLGISHVSLHAWELYMWVWMTRWTRKQKVGPSHTCHPCETQHFSTHTHTYKNKSGKRQLMALMHWLVFVSEFLAHGGLYLSLSLIQRGWLCLCVWVRTARYYSILLSSPHTLWSSFMASTCYCLFLFYFDYYYSHTSQQLLQFPAWFLLTTLFSFALFLAFFIFFFWLYCVWYKCQAWKGGFFSSSVSISFFWKCSYWLSVSIQAHLLVNSCTGFWFILHDLCVFFLVGSFLNCSILEEM